MYATITYIFFVSSKVYHSILRIGSVAYFIFPKKKRKRYKNKNKGVETHVKRRGLDVNKRTSTTHSCSLL